MIRISKTIALSNIRVAKKRNIRAASISMILAENPSLNRTKINAK